MKTRPTPTPLTDDQIAWWINELQPPYGSSSISAGVRGVLLSALTELAEHRHPTPAPPPPKLELTVANVRAGLKYQGWRNFLLTRNGWGIFSRRSHLAASGKPKVPYPTPESARRAADSMARKKGLNFASFEAYRCIFCSAYHIGKNTGPAMHVIQQKARHHA